MSLMFGTPEWLRVFAESLGNDARYKDLSRNYEGGPLLLRTYADPTVHELLARDLQLFFDAYRGEIREARVLGPDEAASPTIELQGSYGTWKEIAMGKLPLKKAILLTRQVKVKGPKVTELVRYMGLADRIIQVLIEMRARYVFPDEAPSSAASG